MFGIKDVNTTNFANSLLPHALSRYLPPKKTTTALTTIDTRLFSTTADVKNVHGYMMLLVGTSTRYGIAHCGDER
jgi:hypothetical protein